MRTLTLILALLLASPALGQATETITFEGLAGITPIAYEPGVRVPKTARVKSITLAGGGRLSIRTRGGAKYAAVVTHMGTTTIVGVGKKGKINPGGLLDLRLRKAAGARIDSLMLLNAGTRRGDDPSTTAVETDFVLGYDATGATNYRIYDPDDNVYPISSYFSVTRTAPALLDLTVTSLDFVRVLIGVGEMVYDDVVVSFGNDT